MKRLFITSAILLIFIMGLVKALYNLYNINHDSNMFLVVFSSISLLVFLLTIILGIEIALGINSITLLRAVRLGNLAHKIFRTICYIFISISVAALSYSVYKVATEPDQVNYIKHF